MDHCAGSGNAKHFQAPITVLPYRKLRHGISTSQRFPRFIIGPTPPWGYLPQMQHRSGRVSDKDFQSTVLISPYSNLIHPAATTETLPNGRPASIGCCLPHVEY